MTRDRVAVLAVRVVALLIAFQGLRDILHGGEYLLLLDVDLDAIFAAGMISSVMVVVLGALLWLYADTIAARALGEPPPSREHAEQVAIEEEVHVDLSGLDVHAVAFSALGVFLLTQAVIRATVAVGLWASFQPPFEDAGRATVVSAVGDYRTTALSAAAHLLLGFALTFGARRLAGVLRRNWWASRGVSRVRRVELVDFADTIRATLTTTAGSDGDEGVALTLFDEDERPRITLALEGGSGPNLVFTGDDGRQVLRLPTVEAVPQS